MIEYRLGKFLKAKKMSSRSLAAATGLSPNTIALIAKAKSNLEYNVSADVMDKICHVLRCDLTDLFKYHK